MSGGFVARLPIGPFASRPQLARAILATTRCGLALAFVTAAASWFLAQLIFALHYAARTRHRRLGRAGVINWGGLKFPEGSEQDYWDCLHFSIIIGVALQIADVSFDFRALRRIGTIHSLLAYTFNTVVVALTINLWAEIS